MLVLSRKPGEEVVIKVPPSTMEREITVTTCECPYGKVRLGFTADKDVPIHRKELLERMREGAA
jgi:carbon storage regulator CsrA